MKSESRVPEGSATIRIVAVRLDLRWTSCVRSVIRHSRNLFMRDGRRAPDLSKTTGSFAMGQRRRLLPRLFFSTILKPAIVGSTSRLSFLSFHLSPLFIQKYSSFSTMMNDPMAGMGQDPTAATSPDDVDSKEVFDPMILQFNLQRIERVRSVMGIASGCIAGIAGLTGWEGIACCLVLHVFVSLMIWAWKMNFNLKAYTRQSWFKYMTGPLQQIGLSFTLFWTLFYGLVFLY